MQDDVEVARRAALGAHVALAGHAQARAGVDARRHLDRELLGLLVAARALAGGAGGLDDLALAAALGAGRHLGELAEDGALGLGDLAGALAQAAGRDRAARLGPRARAVVALLEVVDVDGLLAAEDRVVERQVQIEAQVGAPLGTAPPARTGALGRAAPEEGLEDVAEAAEPLEALEAGPARAEAPLRGGVAELVVALALLGIREDLVGLGELLEALLGPGLLVDVRVVLARQLAVALLQLVVRGALGNAEDLVVIAFGAHGLNLGLAPAAFP
ncbi:hypothetical protein D3C87_1325730 [compost metagenome]